jgi:uroporphyrinogen-III synthase
MADAPPVLLLTRPAAQSARFLAQCEEALGAPVEAVIAPVIEIVPHDGLIDLSPFSGVVFTSENAVAALGRDPEVRGMRAWCVGRRTADAAAEMGFDAASAEGAADDLVALVLRDRPAGTLVHLCGAHVAADVAGRLTEGGVPTKARIVYDQVPQPLPEAARRLLDGTARRVVLPLFSPRSARLLRNEVPRPSPLLRPLAMSAQVAAAWGPDPDPGRATRIATRPRAADLLALVLEELRDDPAC